MFPSAGSELDVKPGGLVVAGVAFLLTRATLLDTLATAGNPILVVAQFVPLVLGLGLTAFGVSLAVSTYDRAFVDTVARWCLLGVVGMFVVVGVAFLATATSGPVVRLRSAGTLANTLIGGAAAGTLLGVRSASNRVTRRLLARRNDQAVLLNRLLRHEVLNALTVVRGQAGLLAGDEVGHDADAFDRNADRIEAAVEEVGFLVRTSGEESLGSIDFGATLDRTVTSLRDRLDGMTVDFDAPQEAVHVRADDHLTTVISALVSHAAEFGAADRVCVDAAASTGTATVTFTADEAWFDDAERAALLDGLPEFDDPAVGYGVSIARLLVEQYGGDISLSDDGRTVTLSIPRTAAEAPPSEEPGVDGHALGAVTVAALLAGVAMGGIIQSVSGSLPVVGALYGVETLTVGWITHLFHSVVFGVVFAAALSRPWFEAAGASLPAAVVAGIGYGVVLWFAAAGLLMSVWLNLVGVSTPLPSLGTGGLLGHVVWGGVLGASFAALRP